MNLQSLTLDGVLSYEEFHERKSEFLHLANKIDLHPAELEWLSNNHYYLVQYNKIYQIMYSKNYIGNYHLQLLYKSEKALTKRGRFTYGSAKEVNRWLGFKLLVEDIY